MAHHGERSLKCIVCEKWLLQPAALLKHVKFHIGERPYGCAVCDKN